MFSSDAIQTLTRTNSVVGLRQFRYHCLHHSLPRPWLVVCSYWIWPVCSHEIFKTSQLTCCRSCWYQNTLNYGTGFDTLQSDSSDCNVPVRFFYVLQRAGVFKYFMCSALGNLIGLYANATFNVGVAWENLVAGYFMWMCILRHSWLQI
jgi:hypothetical protein